MKLYKVCVSTAQEGNVIAWTSSKAQARRDGGEIIESVGEGEISYIQPVVFSATRAGILEMLRKETCHHDNEP